MLADSSIGLAAVVDLALEVFSDLSFLVDDTAVIW